MAIAWHVHLLGVQPGDVLLLSVLREEVAVLSAAEDVDVGDGVLDVRTGLGRPVGIEGVDFGLQRTPEIRLPFLSGEKVEDR